MKNYYIFKLGCQMNLNDAERLETYLQNLGYKKTSEKQADLIFVVACSVRQTAVDRVWGGIKRWQADGKKIFLSGCVLPVDRKKFLSHSISYFDINDLKSLNDMLGVDEVAGQFLDLLPHRSSKIAYITIMTGCDNFCSYCAVPHTRGRETSRPMKDIIAEAETAIADGYQELLLLGQNVNSYKFGFAKLLKAIDRLPGDFTFNFISSNPHDMTEEIIETFAGLEKWPRELHLAMQSGDDEILRKMNRKYTSHQYLKLVENCKLKIDNLILTTDIIVGFPGETKKQFESTVKLVKKIKFDKAYIAQYSPRPGTAAAKLVDDVPQIEKKRRWRILENLINR